MQVSIFIYCKNRIINFAVLLYKLYFTVLIVTISYCPYIICANTVSINANTKNSILLRSCSAFSSNNDQQSSTSSIDEAEQTNKEEIITITDTKQAPLTIIVSPAIFLKNSYAIDTTDYLKNIPGFSSIRNGGTNNELVFRGMSGSRIRILTDSGEMLGACLSHMDPSTAYICPDTFDILNIIKGPQTVLWGVVASGGVLQFQRYHPCFDQPSVQLRSSITIGSNNKIDKNIDSIIGNIHGNIRIIGNTSFSDDYYDGNKRKVHSAWNKWNSDVILSYYPDVDTYLEMSIGQGNGSVGYSNRSMDGLCFARESYGIKTETSNIGNILDKVELHSWYYYINHIMADNTTKIFKTIKPKLQKKCCGSISNDSNKNCTQNNVDSTVWGFRGITTSQWKDIKCYSGLDLQVHRNRKNIKNSTHWKINFISQDSGLFSELVFDKLLNKKIVGGARLEYSIINFNDFYKENGKRISKLYPTGFIRYESKINPFLLYYIGIGSSQCFPNYWELVFANQKNGGNNVQIDDIFKLKSEKTTQIDCGFCFQNSVVNGWVSSYIGYIKDFIACNYLHCYKHDFIDNKIIYSMNNIHINIYGTELGVTTDRRRA